MGLFTGGKKQKQAQKIVLPEGARCDRCGKKIRKNEEFVYIKGELLCENCARAKRDWDFLEMMALFED